MDTLDSFLTDELPAHRRDILDIDKLLKQVGLVFETQFDGKSAWPYEIRKNSPSSESFELSHSTTAMIMGALLTLNGRLSHLDEKTATHWPSTGISPKLRDHVDAASSLLLQKIYKDDQLSLSSTTFGRNDVFTLAWVAEVSRANWGPSANAATWRRISTLCFEMARQKLQASENLTKVTALFDPAAAGTGSPVDHAFPALRLVQVIRHIGGNDLGALHDCYPYFERGLHQQLSFSAIPDSRFDPAELMFCLEGMLQCQRNTVDRTLFDRVISVLTSVQSESAFWRPVKPYMATRQGLALFPVSIEVANSMLRACSIFDRDELYDTYGSKCITLLHRYWQWLRARTVRFQHQTTNDLVGWHSEHVNEPTIIHLWETSQVVEFLLAFRDLLYSHVGRTSLVRSRLTLREPQHGEWSNDREPVSSLGPGLRIFERIENDFVLPHSKRQPKAPQSMLLYGPPGTGKTTIALNLANALQRRLITITVSDFLATGGAQVEARAKDIFQVLESQPPCVVLFDEIDHFLLDRDSERYGDQDTVFQFMTPGMLTKLNDLRKRDRVLFVVATNYEDRIDGAIKRAGRIDRTYLVLPPDSHQRRKILKSLIGESNTPSNGPGIFGRKLNDAEWDQLSSACLFLGWNDIEATVSMMRSQSNPSAADLADRLLRRPRITSLETYQGRFVRNSEPLDAPKTPIGEFLCLVALFLETNRQLNNREKGALATAGKVLLKGDPNIDEDVISRYAPDLDKPFPQKVAEAIRSAAT